MIRGKPDETPKIIPHRGHRRWRVDRDKCRNLGSPFVSSGRGTASTSGATLHKARGMNIRMAELIVVAMKRVTIVEQRVGGDKSSWREKP